MNSATPLRCPPLGATLPTALPTVNAYAATQRGRLTRKIWTKGRKWPHTGRIVDPSTSLHWSRGEGISPPGRQGSDQVRRDLQRVGGEGGGAPGRRTRSTEKEELGRRMQMRSTATAAGLGVEADRPRRPGAARWRGRSGRRRRWCRPGVVLVPLTTSVPVRWRWPSRPGPRGRGRRRPAGRRGPAGRGAGPGGRWRRLPRRSAPP